jgi:hypothetical protein
MALRVCAVDAVEWVSGIPIILLLMLRMRSNGEHIKRFVKTWLPPLAKTTCGHTTHVGLAIVTRLVAALASLAP